MLLPCRHYLSYSTDMATQRGETDWNKEEGQTLETDVRRRCYAKQGLIRTTPCVSWSGACQSLRYGYTWSVGRSVGLQPQSKPCVRANGPNDVIKSTYQSELNSSKLNQLNGEMNQTFVELRPTNLQENQLRNDDGTMQSKCQPGTMTSYILQSHS